MSREVVLDTETTGLDPERGHRIVEIGCVELINLMPSGEELHLYINPERDMPEEAFRVHGLSQSFLAGHPPFAAAASAIIKFLGDAPLVIHNAEFDLRFLDWEFRQLGLPSVDRKRSIDTLALARRRYPGAQSSLDALCRRFDIDTSAREKHGAIVDARLLASVYLELKGGREPGLELKASGRIATGAGGRQETQSPLTTVTGRSRTPRRQLPSEAEGQAHALLLSKLGNPLWLRGQGE